MSVGSPRAVCRPWRRPRRTRPDIEPGLFLECRRRLPTRPCAAPPLRMFRLFMSCFHRRDQTFAGDRQIAHPHAERIEHRIGDRRGDRAVRGFAGAERIDFRPRDLHVHVRHLAEAQDRIVLQLSLVMRSRSKRTRSCRVQLVAWMAPPSIWLMTPSGLMASPTSTATSAAGPGCPRRPRPRRPRRNRRRCSCSGQSRCRSRRRPPQASTSRARRRRDHIPARARPQMPQPERDRIFAPLGGQFVEQALDREHVAVRAERPQRRGADRHDVRRWQSICQAGNRRAGRNCGRRRRHWPSAGWWKSSAETALPARGREQAPAARASRPRRMAVAPDRVPPIDDLAVRIEPRLDLDRHRRAERRVRHLVRARPLHAHRPPPAARASSTASSATSSAPLWP